MFVNYKNTLTMKVNKLIGKGMIALAACFMAMPVQAQQDKRLKDTYPYGFLSAAGGGLWTIDSQLPTGRNRFIPLGQVGIGGMFCPYVGLRATFDVGAEKLLVDGEKTKKTYLYTNFDGLIDITNFFYGARPHLLHLYGIGGVGLGTLPTESRTTSFPYNVRAGGQLEARINQSWGFYVEALGVKRNNVPQPTKQWQVQTMIGVKYCFTGKNNYKADANSSSVMQDYYNAQNALNANAAEAAAREKAQRESAAKAAAERAAAERAAAEKRAAEKQAVCQPVNIFFDLGKTNAKNVDKRLKSIADYVKQYPNTKVHVTGYADAGTGSPEINLAVSKSRANTVATILKQEYGIKDQNLVVDYKGDTVQPFANNDDNRVVVVVAQ